MQLSHPSYLWVGNQHDLIERAEHALQKIFCSYGQSSKDCNNNCVPCKQIKSHAHHAVLWLAPAKQLYTVDQIEQVIHTLSFKLDHGQHFFIVIEAAELLSGASAHKLLKSIEEPPAGYHFMFLAQSADRVLPTIVSRCVINCYDRGVPTAGKDEKLIALLLEPGSHNLSALNAQWELLLLTEHETLVALNKILERAIDSYQHASQSFDTQNRNKAKYLDKLIGRVKKLLEQPPMPGSAKVACRTLFLIMQDSA